MATVPQLKPGPLTLAQIQALTNWMMSIQRAYDNFTATPPLNKSEGRIWLNTQAVMMTVQDDRYATYLTAPCEPGDTIIYIQSANMFPPLSTTGAFVIQIDNEQIYVEGNTGSSLTVLQRGFNNTAAVLHLEGAQVTQQLSITTVLQSAASQEQDVITVANGSNFPSSQSFTILIDPGTSFEEIATVVSAAPTGTGTGTQYTFNLLTALVNNHQASAIVTQILPDVIQQVSQLIFSGNAFVQIAANPGFGPNAGQVIHQEVSQIGRIPSLTLNANGFYNGFLQKWDDATGQFVDDIQIQIVPNS